MMSHHTASIEEALDYASTLVGPARAAEIFRAAAFDDTLHDDEHFAPQLAIAIVRAVGRDLLDS